MAAKDKLTYEIGEFTHLVNTDFRDAHLGRSRKVWVLGAGASIESGIPGASFLCYQWSCELVGITPKDYPNQQDKEELLRKWAGETSLCQHGEQLGVCLEEPGPNGRRLDDFLAQRYFDVYQRRFPDTRAGYESLRQFMTGKIPSVGYLILAQMIGPRSNLFITVNFDNLIADALFLTGRDIPRILDHENVAHLIDIMDDVTQICKIHRDLLKGPQNRNDELQELQRQWKDPIEKIFKENNPIFIGYGGNDHTLMGLLAALPDGSVRRPLWLHYTSDINDKEAIQREVSEPIADFLHRQNGVLVPYTGFDRLMHYAQEKLNLPEVLPKFDNRIGEIRIKLESKLSELSTTTGQSAATDPISNAAVQLVKKKPKRSIDDWITVAEAETDLEERIRIYDDAIEAWEGTKNKQLAWLFYNRANCKQDLKRCEQALTDYNRSIEIDSKDAAAFNNRGNAKRSLKLYEEALGDYNKAIELDSKYVFAFNGRGNTKANLERYQEALADYDRAIELDPTYGTAYYNRGLTKSDLKLYDEAITDYDRAIELDPADAVALNNRANVKGFKKLYEEALIDYDKAIKLDPKYAVAFHNRGNAKRNLKHYEEALADYDKAIELNPKYESAFNSRGIIKADLKRYEEALADYDKAIELDPTYGSPFFNKACTYALQNMVQPAIDWLEKSIQLDAKFAKQAETDPDFNPIRETPEFKALLEKYKT